MDKWTVEGLAEFWATGACGHTEKEIAAFIRCACRDAIKKAAEICEADGLVGIRLGSSIRQKLLGET